MIPVKSGKDLEMLRKAGAILARVMQKLRNAVGSGITTEDIDKLSEELLREENVLAAFKGYRGYPATVCTSVNEEIVHGIPGARKLVNGDIISIDLGLNYRGYFSDAAFTVAVGEIDAKTKKLVDTAKKALTEGIKQARPGKRLFDISYSIQREVENAGFSVVRQFVGHGIGKELHEEPEIPNFGRANEGPLLKSGMVLAIEPMINMGTWEAEILDNGWTAVTKDALPSAHFEHTVAIGENGPEILTA